MENENTSSDLANFTIKHLTKFKDKVGEQNQIDFKECNKMFGRSERYAGLETNILTYLCKPDAFFQEDN